MQHFDAIIVGGGPAGSSCAWKLVQSGMNVAVLDKQSFPRVKPCAGWITPQVIEALELDVEKYSKQHVWQPITEFRTSMIDGPQVHTIFPRPVSYGIRRCEFDTYLLDRCGANVQFEPVQSLQMEQGTWNVNDQYQTPLLIGAGGHFCPVARRMGVRRDKQASVVVAQEIEFEMSSEQQRLTSVQPHVPELYFCHDLSGYGWCFRKGNFLNIGLGRLDSRRVSQHVTDFCQYLRDRKIIEFDLTEKFAGHAYQLYEGERAKLYDDGVLLIGDAAGLAYSHSGEGIRPAIESGLIAASTVSELSGDYQCNRLAEYEKRLTARLGKPLSTNKNSWLPASWQRKIAARLLATKWFTRNVVIRKWFLHANQTALVT